MQRDYALSKRTDVYVLGIYQHASGSNGSTPVQAQIGSSTSYFGTSGSVRMNRSPHAWYSPQVLKQALTVETGRWDNVIPSGPFFYSTPEVPGVADVSEHLVFIERLACCCVIALDVFHHQLAHRTADRLVVALVEVRERHAPDGCCVPKPRPGKSTTRASFASRNSSSEGSVFLKSHATNSGPYARLPRNSRSMIV